MPVLVQKPFQVRHIALDVMASAGPEWTTTSAGRFQSRFPPLFNDLSICQMCSLTLLNYDARLAELCHNEHSRLLSSKASRGNERDLCEETRNTIPPLNLSAARCSLLETTLQNHTRLKCIVPLSLNCCDHPSQYFVSSYAYTRVEGPCEATPHLSTT